MKTEIDYRLVFKSRNVPSPHSGINISIKQAKDFGLPFVRETACIIFLHGEPIAHAEVRQHVIDNDCKFTGQKRALERLFHLYNRSKWFAKKESRRMIWDQFFKRSKHGCELIGEEFVENKNKNKTETKEA